MEQHVSEQQLQELVENQRRRNSVVAWLCDVENEFLWLSASFWLRDDSESAAAHEQAAWEVYRLRRDTQLFRISDHVINLVLCGEMSLVL